MATISVSWLAKIIIVNVKECEIIVIYLDTHDVNVKQLVMIFKYVEVN